MAAKKNKKVKRVAAKTDEVVRILPVRNADGTWHVKNTPVVNADGAVIMKPVDEENIDKELTEKPSAVKVSIDPETGVLLMVPVAEDKK